MYSKGGSGGSNYPANLGMQLPIGITINSSTSLPTAYFSHSNPHDPECMAGQLMRRIEYEFWSRVQPPLNADSNTAFMTLGQKTGKSPAHVARNVMGLIRLSELPKVKAMQDSEYLLDMQALVAIDQVLAKLGNPIPSVISEIDSQLAAWLTPTKPNQVFPSAEKIRRKVRDIAKVLDDSIAFRDKRKKNRYSLLTRGERASIELEVDSNVGVVIHETIKLAAKEHDVSMADALVLLITGKIQPEAGKVVVHEFKATDVEGAPVYVQGHGWTGEGVPASRTVTRDFSAAPEPCEGYQPSDVTRKYVEGRDGTCRAPGCNRPAWTCQLDHRINYADGGPTHPSNLVALCQHHHNMKTDGRAFYILDPVTGDVVWLFEDGTWAVTEATGPLAPASKVWARTVAEDVIAHRRKMHEEAKALKVELDGGELVEVFDRTDPADRYSNASDDIPF